jgi:recombinational DNA repair protein RecR
MLVSATRKCKMCDECVNLVKDDQANSPLDSLRNGEQSYLLYCIVEN